MPKARGKHVVLTAFVDANHADCRLMRRLHTGVLIFVNRALRIWYFKRWNTVESSTAGVRGSPDGDVDLSDGGRLDRSTTSQVAHDEGANRWCKG